MPRMNRLAMALIVSLSCCAVFTSSAFAVSNSSKAVAYRQAVRFYRTSTWHWQRTSLIKVTPSAYREKNTQSVSYLRWDAKLWRKRSIRAKYHAQNVPRKADWLCIQSGYRGNAKVGNGEASWTAKTGNGYYGGLQMDLSFQRHYGGWLLLTKGTANNWTPIEQMWVAENARKNGRGFYPWPNTAHDCGLI